MTREFPELMQEVGAVKSYCPLMVAAMAEHDAAGGGMRCWKYSVPAAARQSFPSRVCLRLCAARGRACHGAVLRSGSHIITSAATPRLCIGSVPCVCARHHTGGASCSGACRGPADHGVCAVGLGTRDARGCVAQRCCRPPPRRDAAVPRLRTVRRRHAALQGLRLLCMPALTCAAGA